MIREARRSHYGRKLSWKKLALCRGIDASIHGAGMKQTLRSYKLQLGIRTMAWPPSSPDFSAIENVWRLLKARIRGRQTPPKTRAELIKAINEEWDRLELADWQGYIKNMPQRMQAGKAAGGLQTKY